jgi:putative transposase
MAIRRRQPREVVHRSDRGSQYTSIAFGNRCRQAGVHPSMGTVGDAYNNAMCESFFAALECELIERVRLRTPQEAETAIFEFIEGWYNPHRRHSALDFKSPMEYELNHLGVAQAASPDLSTETGSTRDILNPAHVPL